MNDPNSTVLVVPTSMTPVNDCKLRLLAVQESTDYNYSSIEFYLAKIRSLLIEGS